MKAIYHSPRITSDNALHFEIENASDSTWNPGDDIRLSYQVLDFTTGALLVEGTRTAMPSRVAPGERIPITLSLDLPEEPGRYRLYVSPMIEGRSWAYAQGLDFLAGDIQINSNEFNVRRLEVTNLKRIHRENRLRAIPRAIFLPFQTIWRNRRLSYTLTRREILSRSRGSFGGALWTILNPLLLMMTYFFVFGIVLKQKFENDPSPTAWALYFLAGMLPWLAVSEATGRAPFLLIEYRQLIRKLVFPVEMLPVNLVFSGLVGEGFGLLLFALAYLVIRRNLPWTILYLPTLLIPQMIFTVGVCWFLSALGAFLRDLTQVIGFLMTVWFFITPICYPESQVPEHLRWIVTKNPMYILVEGYRAVFLRSSAPNWAALFKLTLFSLILAVLSHAWFYKLKKSFADVL